MAKINNLFATNKAAEAAAREEAAKKAEEARKAEQAAAEEKAILDAVEPVDIVGTMDEVTSDEAHCYRDDDGNSHGVNGGKYIQVPVYTAAGMTTIAAETEEEIAAIKARMDDGIMGDQMLHKQLVIGGVPCDCTGRTVEELAEDILAAKKYVAKHKNGSILLDLDVAEQLVDAGCIKEDLKEVRINGSRCLICYSEKAITDLMGNELANLRDIPDTLSHETIDLLLSERAAQALQEMEDEYDDEDYFDDDYEDEEDDE